MDLSSLRLHNPIIFTPDLSCLSPGGGEEDGAKGRKRKWEVVQCRAAGDGRRCDLKDCLQRLWRMGYRRLMVEGTQAILTCHVHKGRGGKEGGRVTIRVLWESREVLKGPGSRCAREELPSEREKCLVTQATPHV